MKRNVIRIRDLLTKKKLDKLDKLEKSIFKIQLKIFFFSNFSKCALDKIL